MSVYTADESGQDDTREIRWSAAHRATAPGGREPRLSWIDVFAAVLGGLCAAGVVLFVAAAVSGWSW